MFKSLSISVTLILCCTSAALVSAQQSSTQKESLAYTKSADDSRDAQDRVQVVSPEARAEARRLYKEGVKYGLAGLFSQAAQTFQLALTLDPRYADAQDALGHAYFDLQRWQQAVESLERATKLNPKDQDTRDRLALARLKLRQNQGNQAAGDQSEAAPQAAGEPVSLNVKSASPPPEATEASANEASSVVSEPALTRIYRVGPSDVLDIRTNDSAPPQSTLFTVTPSGLLEHPMLGEPLPVSGFTVDEIGARIEDDLKRRALIDNPRVVVGVRDYASHTILVSGLVKESGTKILRREAIPLYVVVADAQPLPEAARVTVVRNESNQTFDIELSQPADMNLLVRPGDVITLHPSVTKFVYIGGEVKFPGEKIYRRGLTLTQAVIAAGGVTPKSREARIGRDDGRGFLIVTRFKLNDIESGKIPDPLVQPGDRITIVN